VPLHRPIAELVEEYLSSAVSIDSVEFGFHIFDGSNPLFDNVLSTYELRQVDASIATGVYNLEGFPIFKSLFQRHQEDSELTLFNIISGVLVTLFARDGILGKLKSSHDCWLRFEKCFAMQNISQAFLALS